jgi:hypothetical protein
MVLFSRQEMHNNSVSSTVTSQLQPAGESKFLHRRQSGAGVF